MDLKASSQDLSPSDCASDSEEKEISEGEDEDDDRNHKHRKRETGSQPMDGDFLNQVSTRPYRKRKPFDNGFPYREGDPQSGETSKNHYGASERNFSMRSENRRTNRTPFFRPPMDFNQRIRGNQSVLAEAVPIFGRGMDPLSWGLHNSRLGMVDVTTPMVQSGPVPSGLLAGRGLPNISNAQSTSWNAFGMVPGVPNSGLDGLRHLSLQGALRQSINPAINIGLPRQRCRDFEERGFCLRGDMCPMEHGVNRIVVDDVQSSGVKDVTISDQAFKSLEGGTLPDNAKTETTKSPGTHVIAENIRSAEHAVQHTTMSKPTIVQPSSLRQICQPALLGTPFVGNKFKLDNRPTAFRIVGPLPDGLASVATMKEHFSTYGDLSSVELEESKLQKINDNSVQSDVSALIYFTTRRSAERAFLNGKCWQDHNLQFMWLGSSNSGREGGSPGIPLDSSNMPSEANVHVQPDRDAASIHAQKSDASGCSEPKNLTKESEAESVEKGEDFRPVTTLVSSEHGAS